MNKLHWNSISLEKDFPDSFLEELIDESYRILFESLSQKAQRAILEKAVMSKTMQDGSVQ